jgi:type I restriction enzyme S subunit
MSAVEKEITRAETQRRRGWELRRSKYIWREVINLSKDGSEQLLSVSQYDGVRPASEASRSESLKGYKIVEKGDLVINIMLAWMGGLGVSEYDGIVSPAYAVYKPIAPMEPRFLHYLYRTRRYLADFARHSTGVVPSRWRMYSDDFGQVITELPPLPEQKEIVAYLDAETGRIDKAIAAEEKMIALLQERREIVINEAVGGGGDLNAETQSRRGWEVRPLRAFLRPVSVRNRPDEQLLSVTREAGVIVRDVSSKEENHNYIPDDLSNYKFVAKGQFVINKMKAWQGSYGVSPYDGLVSPAYFVYDLTFPYKAFFNLALRSKVYVPYFQRYSKGIRVDQWDLMPEALKMIPFAYPPLPEQEEIVKRLDRETGKIDWAIEVKRRQIELLRERRQIVIDEAVTGKVKVA